MLPEACPACGGALAPWRSAPAAEPPHAPVALWRCAACGTAVTAEPAGGTELHEEGAYAPGAPRGAALAAPLLGAFDRRRLALLHSAVRPPGRLLDAGAGRGRFVAAARQAGWQARGIEPSERGVTAAASYGVDLERAGIEDAEVAPGSLDAVTLWHVLEHVEDPGAAVTRVRGWLRPGGVALVGAPNLGSLQARVGGDRWYHLDLPRHRTHFTARGLRMLLARRGLMPLRTHHVLAEHNPFGLWQSLVSRATPTPSWLYLALKRAAPLHAADLLPTLLALPFVPAAVLAELAAGLARRGGTIAVLARRA